MNNKSPKDGRSQHIFDQETQFRLEFLCAATEATVEAEAIRNSLMVYEWFLDAVRENNRFYLSNKSGKEIPITFSDKDGDLSPNNRKRQATYRKQLVLSEHVFQRIDYLKGLTGTETNSSVIRAAIKLHSLLIANVLMNNKIQLRDKEDCESFVLFPVSKFVRPENFDFQLLGLTNPAL